MAGKVKFATGRIRDFTCPAGKDQDILWDASTPGLGLRATANGAKAFVFQSKVHGKTYRPTIGSPDTWSIPQAQAEARRLKVMIDNGNDPRILDAQARASDKATRDERTQQDLRQTLLARTAWNSYMESPHPKWGDTHRNDHIIAASEGGTDCKIGGRKAKAGPLASILKKPLHEITASAVTDWLSAESKTRATSALNAYRKFRTFVNWCAEDVRYIGIIQTNCCSAKSVKASLPTGKAKASDVLQREQLALWFKAVKAIPNPVISAYLQALLLTGARRNEMSALKWADVDFVWNTLTLKDKVEDFRKIPLTPYLSATLQALPCTNEWVFSSTSKSGHLTSPNKAHAAAIKAAGVPHVSLHGLRRSFKAMADWVAPAVGVTAQIMGHRPSATAEKHYTYRSIDFLREWHVKIENWILGQANETTLS